VHTHGKTCDARWQEEDSGKDGTGLVHQLARRFGMAYSSVVLLTAAELQEIAAAGKTTIACATDFAECALFLRNKTSYKHGGANCLVPGPMSWRRMDTRMEDLVKAQLGAWPGSGAEGWRESTAGQAAAARLWAAPAEVLCGSDERLLAHIERYRGREFGDNPAASDVYSALKRFAGAFAALLLPAAAQACTSA
jgi:hypothetical protein